MKGKVVIISGPTASGKSTIIAELLKRHLNWQETISYTTRAKRSHEVDHQKYHFVSKDEFLRLVSTKEIIEFEEYAGNLYGTSQSSLQKNLQTAEVVILDLQTKGKEFVQTMYPEVIDIYIYVPNEIIKERLAQDTTRINTPTAQQEARLRVAIEQNRQRSTYTHVVTNRENQIEDSVTEVEQIIEDELK